MSFRLIIKPEAKIDIREIAFWYDLQSEALRDSFLDALDGTLVRIEQNPHQYQIIYREVRRALIPRFPYSVVYVVAGKDVFVLTCFHNRRDPRHWQHHFPE